MQVISGQWLPPTNSISQYANTPARGAFVVAVLALGAAALGTAEMLRRSGRRDRAAAVLLTIAGAAFILAALVPAPAPDAADPLSDIVHQAGAILGTFALTIGGLVAAVRHRYSPAGRCALTAAATGGIALALLTLANFDLDLIGLGRRESWALHQSISLVCMVATLAILPSALTTQNISDAGVRTHRCG